MGVSNVEKAFVREKRAYAGDYMEVSLFSRTLEQEKYAKGLKGNRKRKQKVSRPAQNNLNEKNSKRYAKLLIYANFRKGDYYITLTYDDEHLPATPKDATKDKNNTIDKWKRLYKKKGLELKYFWVTSYQFNDDTGYIQRIHHHVIINDGATRDEIEDCWSTGRGKKRKQLGYPECKRVRPGANGMNEMIHYVTGQEKWINRQWKKGQKRYSTSQNLIKPHETKNDHAWSMRKLEQIGHSNDAGEEQILKRFPDYRIINEPKPVYHEELGWYVCYEMIKNNGSEVP
jgi:hypothetical protein